MAWAKPVLLRRSTIWSSDLQQSSTATMSSSARSRPKAPQFAPLPSGPAARCSRRPSMPWQAPLRACAARPHLHLPRQPGPALPRRRTAARAGRPELYRTAAACTRRFAHWPAGGHAQPPLALPAYAQEVLRIAAAQAGVEMARRAAEEKQRNSDYRLQQLVHWDSVTGLPNRRCFMDRLAEACDQARLQGSHIGLLYLDLQRFRQINDTQGMNSATRCWRKLPGASAPWPSLANSSHAWAAMSSWCC